MNVEIFHNGSNITTSVLKYTRLQQICTGVGTLEISLEGGFVPNLVTWDTLTIYEEGELVGTYNISSVAYDVPAYMINIEAQDDSKKLQDYFIPNTYEVSYLTHNRYWIEKFLDEATVAYSFQEGLTNALVSENTVMGKMSAYDQIVGLLQMSGWYMHFDETNTCIIGKIEADISSPVATFTESDLISVNTSRSDAALRNRAVVWGSASPATNSWVFADVKRSTRWDAGNDSRAAVVSSSTIYSNADAYSLALKMLDEWAQLTYTIELVITGGRDLHLGDVVYVESRTFEGAGVVTTVGSEVSAAGFKTTVTLDEKCPRLFGMIGMKAPVYVGTWGGGVKRKSLDGYSWSNYSSGLTDLHITDLAINEGILSCVAENGSAFISKETWGTWRPVSLPTGTKARATTIDKETNEVRFLVDTHSGYTLLNEWESTVIPSGCETFIVGYTPNNSLVDTYPIIMSGTTLHFDLGEGNSADVVISSGYLVSGCAGYDIDNDGFNDYISVGVVASGFIGYATATGVNPFWTLNAGVSSSDSEDYEFESPATIRIIVESLGTAGFFVLDDIPGSPYYPSIPSIPLSDTTIRRTTYSQEISDHFWREEISPGTYLGHGVGVQITILPEENTETTQYRITLQGSASLRQANKGSWELKSTFHPPGGGFGSPSLSQYFNNSVNKSMDESVWEWTEEGRETTTISGVAISGVMVVNTTLRRQEELFTIMDPGIFPQRVDTSGAYPMLVAEKTLNWFDLVDNTRTASGGVDFSETVYTQLGLTGPDITNIISDMRYANLSSDMLTSSGNMSLLVSISGNLYAANIKDISTPLEADDFVPMLTEALLDVDLVIVSGLNAIETSNYVSEGQYIFSATSGINPRFYQQSSLFAQDMSINLGEYPVTIIRLDDRV